MNTIIRDANFEDIPQVLAIVNHSILYSTSNYSYQIQTLEYQLEWYKKKLASGFPILVADCEGKTVGFGTYGSFREKIGYQFTVEHSVYVAEENIGKGIGKLLLRRLIKKAKSEGFHSMIGVIDASNKDSIVFHKKFGFIENGTIKEVGFKFNKWLDATIMQLFLKK